MCDCLKKVEEKLKSHLMEKVPEGSEVSNGFETGWDNQLMSFTTSKLYVMMKYKLAYRSAKKDGTLAKNLTRLETNLKMTYCPMCGEKYEI
ncbi:hypothetical protein VRB23_06490 [Erwinia aphidicola]|uniref:hypothetical protein n=1 Tax=Erwinia aphidicola TaxID=68334 RepID=UPI0030D00ADF